MSNVQLKLDEIWKNDKLPLVLSSSSLNVAPKETTMYYFITEKDINFIYFSCFSSI